MKSIIKIACVGLGRRGTKILEHALVKMSDVDITMLCDLDNKKLDNAVNIIKSAGKTVPVVTTRYEDVLDNKEIDAVLLFTGWKDKVKMAKASMLAGKYTGIEVSCAQSIDECFELVETYEKTGVPVMMLENCCYGRRELMALNMVKQGLFGEIVHCAGGYCHELNTRDLFAEMVEDKNVKEVSHYRLGYYINGNCENYPTHSLGPISKCLSVNRGNRFVSLSSFASKSCGIKQFACDTFGKDNKYANMEYKQGDIITTVITCHGGQTIVLTLDTTLPRASYSRQFTIRGTKGMCCEDEHVFYTKDMPEGVSNNEDEMFEKYGHPLSKEVVEKETEKTRIKTSFGLHSDGMDWMIFRAFTDSVKNGTNTPIDAYDTAAWMAIAPLSAKSIENGGQPMEFPDFTKGKWQSREPVVNSKYCLDKIIVDNTVGIYDSAL